MMNYNHLQQGLHVAVGSAEAVIDKDLKIG